MFSHVNVHVTIILAYVLIMLILVLWSYVHIQSLFTNILCFFEDAENSKKRKFYKSLIRYFTYFGMGRMISVFLFLHIHMC